MKFLKLIKLFVIDHIKGEKFLTFLSITGVALGIGLYVGVKAATDRALISFEEHIQGINPEVNYEIVDISGIDFDERIYRKIRSVEENTFPLIRTSAYVPYIKVEFDVMGIYTVKVAKFFRTQGDRTYDIEGFFKTVNGVLITRKLAERYNLKKKDVVHAYIYDGYYDLHIVDILDAPSLLPNAVFMDIGNFQEYFGKSGSLTKIDLSTSKKRVDKIRRILPSNLTLEQKSHVIDQQKSLVGSFRYNLQFITFLSVLVGVFLLYNTIFISVVKRRTEIGILRGLGTKKETIVALFTVKGLFIGFIGSAFGILLGQLFASFSIVAVERTISTIYRSISISDYLITWKDVINALILGSFVSFFASVIPAIESAKVRPNESSRAGSFETKYKRNQEMSSMIGFSCVVLGGLLSYIDYVYVPLDFPYLAYIGIILFILGFTLTAPIFLSFLLIIVRRPAHKLFRATGKIAVSDIEGSRYRFSVAMMSVAISSALIVALLSSIFSLKSSFRDWLDTYIVADVFIKPSSCKSNYCFIPLSKEVINTILSFPEVKDIGRFRALQIDFIDNKVTAGFGNTEMWRKYRKKEHPDSEKLEFLDKSNLISISDYLKVKYGLKLGDEIELDTPKGKRRFIIHYTSVSYSTTSGFVYLDRKWLKELWNLDDATQLSIYLKKGFDTEQFIEKLKKRLTGKYSLTITDNRDLKDNSLEIFDRSFALTYAIELIAIVISLIGVVNTLLILVFEKKREISIIRYLGGSWNHIRNIFVLSAGIIGVAGILLGNIMGPAISMVIVHVINKISFGWEVSLRLPFRYLFILIIILFITTLLAGFIPPKVAKKIDPRKFISFE